MDLRGWAAAAGDLLLGACCPGCEQPGWGLCPACRAGLRDRRPHVSREGEGSGCPRTVSCSGYDLLAKRLVTAHKDRGALALAGPLADRLAHSVHALLAEQGVAGPVLLVPVPSAAAAVRRRGYDATGVLAARAARRLAVDRPVRSAGLLAQRRGVADQAGLSAVERARNLDGALRWRRPAGWWRRRLTGTAVVVVDDVVTTGSSLAEASRVLRAGGAEVVGAATVAATALRPPGR